MNTNDSNETRQPPGTQPAQDTVHAEHGYRNEVSWDEGRGRQPYGNRGEVEESADAMPEAEGGDLGEVARRNLDQLEAVKRKPDQRPEREVPREA